MKRRRVGLVVVVASAEVSGIIVRVEKRAGGGPASPRRFDHVGRPRLCGTTSEAVPAALSALYFRLLQIDQPHEPGTERPDTTATRLLFSPPAELRPFLQDG